MFENIKKHLWEDWLNDQINFIENKEWVGEGISKENVFTSPAYYLLKEVDTLISKFEKVEGFEYWVVEAKNSGKNFKHFLFELMVLDHLLLKSDKLILKPQNPLSNKEPEALITKGNFSFYVEMTFLDSIPKSITNKAAFLFDKSRKKFRGSQGIHFVGTFDFFKYVKDVEYPVPKFLYLNKLINLSFERGFGSSVIAFILTNIVIKTSPDFKKNSISKTFYINNKSVEKGGVSHNFFENIFDVDEFKII